MAIHVQDSEADRLLREFASRRGVSLTTAIKLAVTEATIQEKRRAASLSERVQPLIDEISRMRGHRPRVDQKAFMDEMWGEAD